MEKSKTALVFGATGLIGGQVVKQLMEKPEYSDIKVFVRKEVQGLEKGEVVITNFDHLNNYESLINGDEIFCCLGTTIKKAGTQEVFRKTDFDLVVRIASIARKNEVKHFLVISSLGADPVSKNFYLRTKGEMEEALRKLNFERLSILRPSLLLGKRNESRVGETIGKIFMELFSFIFIGKLRKYKAIKSEVVARAMIKIAGIASKGSGIYESPTLQELGKD